MVPLSNEYLKPPVRCVMCRRLWDCCHDCGTGSGPSHYPNGVTNVNCCYRSNEGMGARSGTRSTRSSGDRGHQSLFRGQREQGGKSQQFDACSDAANSQG